ncbi:MAG: T9SS type A sorting domain-containing protein [Bacteroidia bacterium]|nr:T9SS type A sorting domain-containing protein [Bacteroidia bacterium]
MLSLNYWSDSQLGFDGAVVQYSIDGGGTWQSIGDADVDEGINWYNSTNLSGNPGGQDNVAWSGSTGEWRNAKFNLDQITTGKDQVVFRVAFGSNDDNPAGNALNGFAFDDVYIGEKKRNVLVEHFSNLNSVSSSLGNDHLDGLYSAQLLTKPKSDFFKIEYHIDNPGFDSLNYYNTTDPAARSLLYGISTAPGTVMDGILGAYYNVTFNTYEYLRVTPEVLDRRALEDPLFEITIDTIASSSNVFSGTLHFKYLDTVAYAAPVVVQLVLVETDVQVGGAPRIYKNVVRKHLLGPDGVQINSIDWKSVLTRDVDYDRVIDVKIKDKNKLYLVAYIQDLNTRRIHQSIVVKAPAKTGAQPVGVDDDPALAEIADILVFPNPATNNINFKLDNMLVGAYDWKIVDQRGVDVLKGSLNSDLTTPQTVDVSELASGIYFVVFVNKERALMYKKVAIMNRTN